MSARPDRLHRARARLAGQVVRPARRRSISASNRSSRSGGERDVERVRLRPLAARIRAVSTRVARRAGVCRARVAGSPGWRIADPWLAPGDEGLRSDIQLLADAGILRGPVTTWPLVLARHRARRARRADAASSTRRRPRRCCACSVCRAPRPRAVTRAPASASRRRYEPDAVARLRRHAARGGRARRCARAG